MPCFEQRVPCRVCLCVLNGISKCSVVVNREGRKGRVDLTKVGAAEFLVDLLADIRRHMYITTTTATVAEQLLDEILILRDYKNHNCRHKIGLDRESVWILLIEKLHVGITTD